MKTNPLMRAEIYREAAEYFKNCGWRKTYNFEKAHGFCEFIGWNFTRYGNLPMSEFTEIQKFRLRPNSGYWLDIITNDDLIIENHDYRIQSLLKAAELAEKAHNDGLSAE